VILIQLSEYAELGSLKTYLQRPPSDLLDHCAVTVSMLLEYSIQIAHGLHYLESQSFVHGDLAACNIMRTDPQQVLYLLLLIYCFHSLKFNTRFHWLLSDLLSCRPNGLFRCGNNFSVEWKDFFAHFLCWLL